MSSAFENYPLQSFCFPLLREVTQGHVLNIQHLDLRRTPLSLHQNSLGWKGFSMLWRGKKMFPYNSGERSERLNT